LFVVEIKKHGASDDNYHVYTKLRIDPITGAVMEELPYQHIPGITPEPVETVVIPQNFEGMSKETATVVLESLGLIVVEQNEINEDWVEGAVVRVEYNGFTVYAGQELEKGATVVLVVSSGSAHGGTDPTDPPVNPDLPLM
jgi:hypothetical protein